MTQNKSHDTQAAPSSRRALGMLGAALALAVAAKPALAQGPGGFGGGHGMRDRMSADPAMQERLLERRTSHMLDAVEATPEQRSRVMAIAKAAFKDIAPMRAQAKASREKGRLMMFDASLDRAGLEQLRQAQMKLRDAMSQRTLAGMLEALSVLTPEQRAKLAARKPHGDRRR